MQPSGPGQFRPSTPPVPTPIPPSPGRDSEPRTPRHRQFDLPVTTGDVLPGGEFEHLGVVIGVVTRPRDLAHSPEISYITTEVRQDAIAAMVRMAQELGADAVVGTRFDAGYVTESVSEVTAYGTAMKRVG